VDSLSPRRSRRDDPKDGRRWAAVVEEELARLIDIMDELRDDPRDEPRVLELVLPLLSLRLGLPIADGANSPV
jgi:hypothetical protein